jgi:hypothetical protein
VDVAVAELDRRSIPHSVPFRDPAVLPVEVFGPGLDGSSPWTVVSLGGLLGDRWLARVASGPLGRRAVAERSMRTLVRHYRRTRAQRLVCEVSSRDTAAAALREENLLGTATEDAVQHECRSFPGRDRIFVRPDLFHYPDAT